MNAQQARRLFEDWLRAEGMHIGEVSSTIAADQERLLDVAAARARELRIAWTPNDADEWLKLGTKYDDD